MRSSVQVCTKGTPFVQTYPAIFDTDTLRLTLRLEIAFWYSVGTFVASPSVMNHVPKNPISVALVSV